MCGRREQPIKGGRNAVLPPLAGLIPRQVAFPRLTSWASLLMPLPGSSKIQSTCSCVQQLGSKKRLLKRLTDSCWKMAGSLQNVLEALREHQADLQVLGVAHAAVFGSVARGEARADSDD